MKVTIVDSETGKRHRARVAASGKHAEIEACPRCGATPGVIQGTGITHHNHDTYFAPAVATCCDAPIGTIETRVDTFFGIDEDNAAQARCRVYDGTNPSRGRAR